MTWHGGWEGPTAEEVELAGQNRNDRTEGLPIRKWSFPWEWGILQSCLATIHHAWTWVPKGQRPPLGSRTRMENGSSPGLMFMGLAPLNVYVRNRLLLLLCVLQREQPMVIRLSSTLYIKSSVFICISMCLTQLKAYNKISPKRHLWISGWKHTDSACTIDRTINMIFPHKGWVYITHSYNIKIFLIW